MYLLRSIIGTSLVSSLIACTSSIPSETIPIERLNQPSYSQSQGSRMVTFGARDAATQKDVNAQCRIIGDNFSANFVTPARVAVPNMAGSTQSVYLTCNSNGRQITQKIEVSNLTTLQTPAPVVVQAVPTAQVQTVPTPQVQVAPAQSSGYSISDTTLIF